MTESISEKLQAPTIAEVDVLVCGAGPAGIGAAIRAAREGVSVMMVEALDCIGGIATAGMMSHWGGFNNGTELRNIQERSAKLLDCPEGKPDGPEKQPAKHNYNQQFHHDLSLLFLLSEESISETVRKNVDEV